MIRIHAPADRRGGTPEPTPWPAAAALPPPRTMPRAGEDVLTARELYALACADSGGKTLTVYLDTHVTDPAMRHAWRPALTSALRAARARIAAPREAADFDRAVARLDEAAPTLDGTWRAPGWVAFLAPDGLRYAAEVPVRVPTLAVWRDGPVVSPYLRALKQQRPVVVVLVDSRSARFFGYAWGRLTPFPAMRLATEDAGAIRPAANDARASAAATPRGPLDPERLRRRQMARFRRLATRLVARVTELAGEDGWVLIGGTAEWARHAAESFAGRLTGRVLVSQALDAEAADDQIANAARRAASTLRAAAGRARLERLIERAHPHGTAELGLPATQRALRGMAVELLLLSPEFLRAHPHDAEDAVRAALAQGAALDVLSGDAAALLDRAADGIAARLRFPLDGARPRRAAATGSVVSSPRAVEVTP